VLIYYSQTVASIYAFFKAMALYPQVAAMAQAEIDLVVGSERLPSFADRDNLPFINALVLEVHRWHAVAPTGMSMLFLFAVREFR
jgi:cytochrome P450